MLQAWFPVQQISKLGLWGNDWIINGLTYSWIQNLMVDWNEVEI
jgi:hypothetical protein